MILPARRRAAALAAQRFASIRAVHPSRSTWDPLAEQSPSSSRDDVSEEKNSDTVDTSAIDAADTAEGSQLTGSEKLFADALLEEQLMSSRAGSSRDHLRLTQGEIWTGEESQVDAVLRMLVDAHRPLRTGEALGADTADKKIKGMMKGLRLEPRMPSVQSRGPQSTAPLVSEDIAGAEAEAERPSHRTSIPPHLHRPWHATYTGASTIEEVDPKIKCGMFIKKRANADDLSNILELQLPPGADGKTRSKIREARKSHRKVTRLGSAREEALDYRLSQGAGEMDDETAMTAGGEGEGDDGTFTGNRQVKGSSVLGAAKGGASGLRAWAGLVEDRIQRAREAGMLTPTQGLGKPIPVDPNAGNPFIERGELFMNRIVKRQGALPPWIELQNNLDAAVAAFRSTLLTTYTTHLVRTVIATNSLDPLPPDHAIPDHDEAWEAREKKFHEENIKQLNDLVRRMNAQAPSMRIRRPLMTLDVELERVRSALKENVKAEVQRRAEDYKASLAMPKKSSSPYYMEIEGLSRLKQATRRSLWTLAHPIQAVIGKGSVGGISSGSSRSDQQSGDVPPSDLQPSSKRLGLFFLAGLGLAGVVYLRRPAENDSSEVDFNALIPLVERPLVEDATPPPRPPSHVVALSRNEPTIGPVLFVRLYILEPFLTLIRFLHLAALFGPVVLTSPMLFIGKPERRRRGKPIEGEDESWGAVWWYGFLVKQMERAGPSFIKLGQWAASRADLFPAALCDLMSKLHSNGQPHSIKHTKRALERAFGMRFDEVFEEFDETPIGCGAIAQVYKGRLRAELIPPHDHPDHSPDLVPTTSVAIKVLHPRVRKLVRRDIAIMSVFANIINLFPGMSWLSLPEEVQVFGDMMNSQLDLRVEGANLERFERNFQGRGARVVFPRPIKLGNMRNGRAGGKESREVLMEEFEDALPLKYFLRNGGGPYDDRIASIGLDAFLEMLLLDNWTHGDLHPGNIMVRFYKPTSRDLFAPLLSRFSPVKEPDTSEIPEHSRSADALVHSLSSIAHEPAQWVSRLEQLEKDGYEPQLIFIDAGLVTTLDGDNRKNFLDLFQAVAEFDGYKAGKLMVERCRTPEYAIDEETFALKIQHLVLSVKSKTFSLAKIKISDILTDVLTAVRQHHVKLEGDFVNTVISILLLEGIGRQLDPDMDLFKSALPILRQVGRQMGTREAIAAVPKGNIWAMIKLWVWVEARQVAGEASAIDNWIKYDRLMPAV